MVCTPSFRKPPESVLKSAASSLELNRPLRHRDDGLGKSLALWNQMASRRKSGKGRSPFSLCLLSLVAMRNRGQLHQPVAEHLMQSGPHRALVK